MKKVREFPFLVTTCPKCGKQISLKEESDFHARFEENHLKFFYTCPECKAIEEHPECFLPTYLKEKLIQNAVVTCPKCGKQIHLREETDFHARFEENSIKFLYTCPECGAVEEHPGCFIPTFLREKLVQDAIKRKTLIEFILIMAGIVVIGFVLFLLLFR